MELHVYRHLWGLLGEGGTCETLEQALDAVQASPVPYAGIEHAILLVGDDAALSAELERRDLGFIPMMLTFGQTVEDHIGAFRMQLERAQAMPHQLVVSHSGRDSFDEEQSAKFFEEALRIERDLGVAVAHETHRGRILFNPWVTLRMLKRFEALMLNCDLSHWVVVAERLLESEMPLEQVAPRARHVHARVGFENGPQVSDPRAPEFKRALNAHEGWWSAIWDAQRKGGTEVSTLTPEFGPPSYQPTLPNTLEPVGDLAEVCDWMAARQLERFASRGDAA